MPHAYKGGTQVALLKAQIEAMPEGGTFAMVAPPNPFRCPPGPYERISMVAMAAQADEPDREDPARRSQGELLQAGALRGGLAETTIPAWSTGSARISAPRTSRSTPTRWRS
jgi:sulfide dehydrogenase [flavocytochrome c] flavoprotein chain